MKRHCLIVFVKSPEVGGVKTRLAAAVGEKKTHRLYRCFVEDLLDSLDTGNYCLKLFFYPPDEQPVLSRWLGCERSYEPQAGDDLGQRMKNAFEKCFAEGFDKTILIGSDSPDLPREIIDEGFAALTSCDAVIGPSCDGGYYLIGFNTATFLPELFLGIPWSTGAVLKSTRAILDKKGLSVSLLPPWRDIDTHEDLKALVERHRNTPFAKSRTVRFALSRNGSE
ncbi:MAG: TIGR04282 family arsenosugar biosynthesis glycosyltransferase [Syntrophales bacterium]|nr:TIGR04282 family arsenosugar biosynthesis glycosyltransferase [Syntrophales bacterium]